MVHWYWGTAVRVQGLTLPDVQALTLKGNALLSQCGNASSTGIQHDTEGRSEESVLSSLQALPVD